MCSSCRIKLLSNYIELSELLAVWVYGGYLKAVKKSRKIARFSYKIDDSRDYKLHYEQCPSQLIST